MILGTSEKLNSTIQNNCLKITLHLIMKIGLVPLHVVIIRKFHCSVRTII